MTADHLKKPQREAPLLKEILLALGNESDFRVWRNSTGALYDSTGRLVRFGLAPGSADIIGILAPLGRLVALEVKTHRPGSKQSDDQINWARVVRELGGIYEVVRSVDDARSVLAHARQSRPNQDRRAPPP